MNLKTIISGQGGGSLLVTAVFTPDTPVSDERLQQLQKILSSRMSGIHSSTGIIGDSVSRRHDLRVEAVDGKIVLSMQYAHSTAQGFIDRTFAICEGWALHDANAVLEHLKQYLAAFEG